MCSVTQPLDRLDHQILHALGINGRVPFRRLAQALDASEHTVARRYRRLVERDVVRVVAAPAPRDSDMGQLLRLQVHPGSSKRLTEALVNRDDVSWLRTAGGGAEIMCGVRAPSSPQRDKLILEQLPRTGKVTRVTTYDVLHHFRTPGHADWEGFPDRLDDRKRELIRDHDPTGAPAPRPAAEDAALLKALTLDARQSSARLAAATGQPESTVRRRLDQLLACGAIQLDRDLDPLSLGYPISASLYIDVSPKHLHAAGAALAAHRPTTFVAAVTGPANLHAAVSVRTLADLYDYVSSTLTEIDGVLRVETCLAGPFLKHARTIWLARHDR
ncbi:transcriptional regulator, AsnC family [Stackebrandtia nassauensis DSM 44728]|uniref:Transcriptional regulator, AsnC family n=1 Tax=Stackebrandtia nassauensis (strain DSM 44728 / CIP 108903 / NRRL B-16338 / NBRC 102104 / LLR-40K-21) TaxID=446470 RepID=D3Q7D1_STANL|nr:transcriptional regulator, AsnC family [Stackebrandtia nassauensis DSM 44728]